MKIKKIEKSSYLEGVSRILAQKRNRGVHVYNFLAGDPVIHNHNRIIYKALEAAHKRASPYPNPQGVLELRNAAAAWMNGNYNCDYTSSNVIVTCGGKFAITAALNCLLNPGEEVIIHAPYWMLFPEMIKINGFVPKIVIPAKPGMKLTVKHIEKNVTSKTRVLLLNSANNPSGVIYSEDELRAILEFAKRSGLVVLSDEVYGSITFGDNKFISCSQFTEYKDHVIVVQSCSKIFAMPGWRVGFAFGPPEAISAMTYYQSLTTSGTALISQWAALGAVEKGDEVISYVKEAILKRRDVFADTFYQLFRRRLEKPKSGFYFFLPLSDFGVSETSSVKFCEKALEESNVAMVPGISLGYEGFVRFSFVETEGDIISGLKALKSFCEKLSPQKV